MEAGQAVCVGVGRKGARAPGISGCSGARTVEAGFFLGILFIFWQCWVLSLLCGLFSLVVANEGYFLVAMHRLLLLWNIDML